MNVLLSVICAVLMVANALSYSWGFHNGWKQGVALTTADIVSQAQKAGKPDPRYLRLFPLGDRLLDPKGQ